MTNNQDDLRQRLRRSLDRGPAPDLSANVVRGAAGHRPPRFSNPATTFRVAGGAVLAVAAVTVGALVLGPGMSQAPLFTVSATSGTSALGASDAMSGGAKMMIWVDYRYTAGSSLSTAGSSGPVYQLVLDTANHEARAAELAEVFGIDGSVRESEYSQADFPTWVVGPQDGTGMDLTLSAYGTGDWWFNDPSASSIYVCDSSVTSVDAADYGCVLPSEAPANEAPVGDEARALAKALFASTGYQAAAADIEITSGDDGTNATAYLTVEGTKTGLSWSAYWSNTGALAYAYGHSVHPEARGTFDTVSPTDAVQRLSDYRWFGSSGPEFQGGMMMYARGAELGDAPGAEPGSGEEFESNTEPVIPPASEPAPEIVEVTVEDATSTLLLMWDAEGNAWLVPGYAMKMPEGWWNAVVSLVDGVIALPNEM